MKKAFESGKIWTILSAVIFVMMCGLVVFAGYITNVTSNNHFTKWRTEELTQSNGDPILTGGDWNAIMDSLNGLVIPKGAIMAFTGTCPDGWSHFSNADDRFLMGVKESNMVQVLGAGGRNEFKLEARQLPPHSHYIRYGDTQRAYGDNASKRAVVVDWYSARYPWNPEEQRGNHNPQDTTSYSFHDVRTAPYGPYPTVGSQYNDFIRGGSGSMEPIDSIDITNKYVKVNFCIKD